MGTFGPMRFKNRKKSQKIALYNQFSHIKLYDINIEN